MAPSLGLERDAVSQQPPPPAPQAGSIGSKCRFSPELQPLLQDRETKGLKVGKEIAPQGLRFPSCSPPDPTFPSDSKDVAWMKTGVPFHSSWEHLCVSV